MTNPTNLWRGNPVEFSSRGPSCPHCRATASVVKDSRQHHEADGSTYVRRRRECQECRKRFTTFELGSRITKLDPALVRGLRTLRAELDRLLNLPTVTFSDD